MALKKKPVTAEEAKLKMASLCSRSEQCEADVSNKLYKLGLSSGERTEIINYLKEERFIDNSRFAKAFARDKARFSYWGPKKIKAALALKKISSSEINEALSEVDEEDWTNALMKSAISKSRNLDLCGEEGYENRRKLFTFLIGRGFTGEQANRGVRIMKEKQKDEE